MSDRINVEPQESSSSGTPTTRSIATTAPLAGGGDLSADRTLSIGAASGSAAGSMSSADYTKLAGIAAGATVGLPAPYIQGLIAISQVGTSERFYRSTGDTGTLLSGALRVYVPATGTWRLRAAAQTQISGGETLTVSAIAMTSLSSTATSALALTFVNADGAAPVKSNTFSATGATWLGVSFLYTNATPYGSTIAFTLERVS